MAQKRSILGRLAYLEVVARGSRPQRGMVGRPVLNAANPVTCVRWTGAVHGPFRS